MSKHITESKPNSIEYRIERNTRYVSYKGRYNCEVFVNGHFATSASGDTASQAKQYAEIQVARWQRTGKFI